MNQPSGDVIWFSGLAHMKTTSSTIILILESDAVLRSVLRDVLEATGYVIREAKDLGAAVLKAREAAPDLLVTGPYVDSISGYDAASFLRKDSPEMDILVVAGFPADDRIENRLLNHGFTSFPAPYTPALLLESVRKMLSARAERPQDVR
jgi:DNA-binding NtrC family response regulator